MNKFNVYKQFRASNTYICENFFENLLRPKRMQVFTLKLQYQNELSDFLKRKTVDAYEFHLMSNSNVQLTLWAWKILKNFIKNIVIANEIYLYLWSFLDFLHKISGKPNVIGKNGLDIRVMQEKSYQIIWLTFCDFETG